MSAWKVVVYVKVSDLVVGDVAIWINDSYVVERLLPREDGAFDVTYVDVNDGQPYTYEATEVFEVVRTIADKEA